MPEIAAAMLGERALLDCAVRSNDVAATLRAALHSTTDPISTETRSRMLGELRMRERVSALAFYALELLPEEPSHRLDTVLDALKAISHLAGVETQA